MKFVASCCAAILSLACISGAVAAPITFNFVFNLPPPAARGTGSPGPYAKAPAAPQGNVVPRMSGSITFESTLLANPGSNSFNLPNPAVLALNVTVTNSGVADGSFTMADFTGVVFDTNGGTLNFNQQLVGQPTAGDPWGTPSGGDGGDFNLFSRNMTGLAAPSGGALPPNGVFYFTLGSNGGNGPAATLGSMSRAAGAAVVAAPGLGGWAMALLAGLFGLGASLALRRVHRGA